MKILAAAALLALATLFDPCDGASDPCPERCKGAADPDVCAAQCEHSREPGGGHLP